MTAISYCTESDGKEVLTIYKKGKSSQVQFENPDHQNLLLQIEKLLDSDTDQYRLIVTPRLIEEMKFKGAVELKYNKIIIYKNREIGSVLIPLSGKWAEEKATIVLGDIQGNYGKPGVFISNNGVQDLLNILNF